MSTNLFDLNGKIALVTGASRGIGEAIARLLAKQGAHVIISSRRLEDCQQVAQSILADGDSAEALACHVGSMEAIETCFRQIRETHGRLDILVNNAATNPYYGHVLDTDLAAYQKTVDVNLRGYFFMSVEAGKMMKAQGGGAIVNVASVNALQPAEYQGIYSITKAAVVNMTKTFAKECGRFGIRVNALLPGLTRTRFAAALFQQPDLYEQCVSNIPLHRHAEPDEMAGTVLYLVSNAASYTNGECIVVDGGLTL
ncbi:short-chain dehydrogenase [Marinobacterium nitratireducens]|uniref:Short-chain dehydrogenase n=1 Tax=Marinobacterium nitratireducens TaxID=518897 RepID=A0A918DQ13_9GAMM|nr:SDR family oxidoreductase [Marinobacterium nitratireducens]GGO79120.1 short-chain dehydrogenase [Marinobacterium nitratireducens]